MGEREKRFWKIVIHAAAHFYNLLPSYQALDVGKLKDERVAEEFANKLSGDLGGSGCFGET